MNEKVPDEISLYFNADQALDILEGEGFSYDFYPDLSNKHRVYTQVSWH